MDYKEAIRILHPDTTAEAISEIKYYHGFNGGIAATKAVEEACMIACDAMKALEANLDVWIPLSQEKPEEGQAVHISTKNGNVIEGLYTRRYGFNLREGFIVPNGNFMAVRDANAWMPKRKLMPYIEPKMDE